jgi:hypothetical protein
VEARQAEDFTGELEWGMTKSTPHELSLLFSAKIQFYFGELGESRRFEVRAVGNEVTNFLLYREIHFVTLRNWQTLPTLPKL